MRLILAGFVASLSWLALDVWALPPGEGERLVREHCSSCHRPEILNRAQGYNTISEWRRLMASMVAAGRAPRRYHCPLSGEALQVKACTLPDFGVRGRSTLRLKNGWCPRSASAHSDPVEGLDGSDLVDWHVGVAGGAP